MQIICPNCGSKSPIEAGSLVTQTRIVCARCAVEFAAELSDEQKAAPTPVADERGIELFCTTEAVAPVAHGLPAHADEVAVATPAEVVPADEVASAQEVASEVVGADEVAPADEVAAIETVVESADEALPAAEVSPADVEVEAVAAPPDQEAAPPEHDSAAASDVYEVLSLPEEAMVSNESATRASAAAVDHLAEVDHANVLEDVFAAWTQSRESKPEADASPAELIAAADDYVTTPLSPDYETAAREEHQPVAESTELPSAEVIAATTNESVPEAPANGAVGLVEANAEEAARSADDEREPVHASFAGVSVPPQVAAARSFDGYGLGVRLLRVSPLWLLVSGLSFISFVVFCNWFFVPANLAQAEAVRPASRGNEATNRSPVDAASAAGLATEARADARNSDTSRAESLSAEGEVIDASLKVEEPTPATSTTSATAATPAPTPEPTPEPKVEQPKAVETVATQPAPAGKFTVQVGSYNVAGEAEARAANLRSAGQSVRVVEVEIPKRGKWYRVYVGGFASRTDAESHGKGLRERGLAESYIATESQ